MHWKSLTASFFIAIAACAPEMMVTPGTAPVNFGVTTEGGTLAGAPPAFAPQAKRLELAKSGVTITSVRVVLANVNLRGKAPDSPTIKHKGPDAKELSAAAKDGGAGKEPSTGKSDDDATSNHRFRNPEEVDFKGPFVVDLLNGTITPNLEGVTVPVGVYKKVDLTLQVLTTADAAALGVTSTDKLIGNSYLIEALLNDVTIPGVITGGTAKLVVFGDQAEEYRVNLKHGLEITGGPDTSVNDVLLVFNAAGWFPDPLLGQLRSGLQNGSVTYERDANGQLVVYLDATRNHSVASALKKAFRNSVKLAKDANHDKHLDATEQSESLGDE